MITDNLKKAIIENPESFNQILGQNKTKDMVRSALLAKRHIIINGPPGIGKTTLAKSIANLLGEGTPFVRVQGSPDLTVEDLLGDIDPIKAMKHGPLSVEAFSKGKIFKADKGVLFFDELNRCPEKIQNALLQVLEEGKSTIGSYDVDFDIDFLFIATMNPEDTSTEALSDVMLDRFDMIYMTYPDTFEDERKIIQIYGESLCDIPDSLVTFIVQFVRVLRESPKIEKKPSVRATLGLYERTQAHALVNKRSEATIKDFYAIFKSVLAHRIKLKPSSQYLISPQDFVEEEFQKNIEGTDFEAEVEQEKGDGL